MQNHLETFLALCRDEWEEERVSTHAERELRRYLECGILAYGFARARCGECGHDFLVAFSCKGRAVCPSCNARRMAETAAPLVDHVSPPLPVRQWVLSLPKRLRYYLQHDRKALNTTLRILLDEIERYLRAHSPGTGADGRAGAVAFIHRFGSSLNRHTHFHVCVIDGADNRGQTTKAARIILGIQPKADSAANCGQRSSQTGQQFVRALRTRFPFGLGSTVRFVDSAVG